MTRTGISVANWQSRFCRDNFALGRWSRCRAGCGHEGYVQGVSFLCVLLRSIHVLYIFLVTSPTGYTSSARPEGSSLDAPLAPNLVYEQRPSMSRFGFTSFIRVRCYMRVGLQTIMRVSPTGTRHQQASWVSLVTRKLFPLLLFIPHGPTVLVEPA